VSPWFWCALTAWLGRYSVILSLWQTLVFPVDVDEVDTVSKESGNNFAQVTTVVSSSISEPVFAASIIAPKFDEPLCRNTRFRTSLTSPGLPSNPTTTYPVTFSLPTSTPGPTEKTAVCHNDKVTLHLPSQAVRAHLENHGDILGECSDNISTSQEKSKQQAKKLQLKADKAKADRLAKQEADKAQREADRLIEQQAKKLQLEADKAQKESIVEAKNNKNNSKKDNKESKLPTPGPK